MDEQCLHSPMVFSVSHIALPVSRLGVHQNLGGDTIRTAGLVQVRTCTVGMIKGISHTIQLHSQE